MASLKSKQLQQHSYKTVEDFSANVKVEVLKYESLTRPFVIDTATDADATFNSLI